MHRKNAKFLYWKPSKLLTNPRRIVHGALVQLLFCTKHYLFCSSCLFKSWSRRLNQQQQLDILEFNFPWHEFCVLFFCFLLFLVLCGNLQHCSTAVHWHRFVWNCARPNISNSTQFFFLLFLWGSNRCSCCSVTQLVPSPRGFVSQTTRLISRRVQVWRAKRQQDLPTRNQGHDVLVSNPPPPPSSSSTLFKYSLVYSWFKDRGLNIQMEVVFGGCAWSLDRLSQ